MSDLHSFKREGNILSQPSPRAWRPSVLRETLAASSPAVEFPAPRPGLRLLGVLHLLLIWPPPVPISSTSDYLPESQVGPQGESQAPGPFLIWPTPIPRPPPCHS